MAEFNDYAIVIGIDNYSSLPVLTGARTDATRFAEWLQDESGGGLKPENIELILSSELSESPTPVKEQIDAALKRFKVLHRRRLGRRLYFYFSGHGYGQIDDIGMLMAPASEDEANFNIGLRPYKIFFSKWGFFDEVIFILDCCRDPLYFAKTEAPVFTFPDHEIPKIPPKVENFVVLATDHGRQAFSAWDPSTGQKRGILTRAVLEGLQDELATDENGRITASSLRDFVRARVLSIASELQLEQRVEIISPTLGEIIFKEGLTKMQEIGVQMPPDAKRLTIRNSTFKSIGRYQFDNASGDWTFEYLVQEEQLKKFVKPGKQAPINGESFRINLIQNARYALQMTDDDVQLLDLKQVETFKKDFIYKFQPQVL